MSVFIPIIVWLRIFLFQFPVGYEYEQFQWELPNGLRVPNPCSTKGIWSGVGHLGPKGSGPRNEFGMDFQRAKFTWNRELCMKDSDGDGKYNGAELGDPWCMWRKLHPIRLHPATSHPGVCEPWDSPKCKNRNGSVVCSPDMKCSAAYEPGIQEFNVHLPLTRVPMQEETYMCITVNLPTDRDYHMIEAKPALYNRRVVEDMAVYACDKRQTVPTGKSFTCQHMARAPCDTLIAIYSSDTPITCLHDDVGVLVGQNGIKQIMLKVHMVNPQQLDYEDKSGMTLYLSTKMRNHNAGFALIDSTVFDIPPGHASYPVVGGCPGDCTLMRVKSPVYVIFGTNHMHSLGRKQRIELIRNKKIVALLTEDDNYRWKTPRFDRHINPVQIFPGDSIRMICEFDSSKLNHTVSRGYSDTNEMCQSQLIYYPAESWQHPICRGYKHVPLCKFETIGSAFDCHFKSFVNSLINDTLTATVINRCGSTEGCSDECLKHVAKERQHVCLQGELYSLWKSNVFVNPDPRLVKLYTAMIPCEAAYENNARLIPNSHSRGSTAAVLSPNVLSHTTQTADTDDTAAFIPPNLKTLFKNVIDGTPQNVGKVNALPLLSPADNSIQAPQVVTASGILDLHQLKPASQIPVGSVHFSRKNIMENQQLLPQLQRLSHSTKRPVNTPIHPILRNHPFNPTTNRSPELLNILSQVWRSQQLRV